MAFWRRSLTSEMTVLREALRFHPASAFTTPGTENAARIPRIRTAVINSVRENPARRDIALLRETPSEALHRAERVPVAYAGATCGLVAWMTRVGVNGERRGGASACKMHVAGAAHAAIRALGDAAEETRRMDSCRRPVPRGPGVKPAQLGFGQEPTVGRPS